MSDCERELSDLLTALCDERLSEAGCARLESIVLADREALRFYLHYTQLHGLLHWDVAGARIDATSLPEPLSQPASTLPDVRRPRLRTRHYTFAALAAAVCVLIGWAAIRTSPSDPAPQLADQSTSNDDARLAAAHPDRTGTSAPPSPPVRLSTNNRRPNRPDATNGGNGTPVVTAPNDPRGPIETGVPNRSSETIVAVIDRNVQEHWAEHGVAPAPVAGDAAWVRRVHLDLIGRIPEADAVVSFLESERPDKRARLIDDLLSSPEFARHYSVVWTNLLIGHTAPREVNRPALEKFLREQFHRNRPWSETVTELIAAEGREDENGAANFLLAHVNNEAVPATAVTARVLLCEQVQCTQCHNHPFVDWTQDRFWQLNAFFQQTEIVRHPPAAPSADRGMRAELELVSLPTGGPTFYEDRQARVQVAYPEYNGVRVDESADVNRREELARLLLTGEQPQVARALVNRMWGKLFGYGFTDPIDDMGPHKQPVLPGLLDSLTAEFVRSGFDVKQLVRWICLSQPYQLAATVDERNAVDDPEAGHPPLFSRMYAKPLTAEQLFDSLLTATQADRAGARYWEEVEARRRGWLQQFYRALDNDENSEEDAFEGSLAQTLVMMNGDLIRKATSGAPGTVLQQVLTHGQGEDEQIRLLSLATLSRPPTAAETAAVKRLLRQQVQARPRDVPPQTAFKEGLRDLMWAYLNSTEFRTNL